MFKSLMAIAALIALTACAPSTHTGYGVSGADGAAHSTAGNERAGSEDIGAPMARADAAAPAPMAVARVAASGSEEANLLSSLGATTNPDGSVTVYEGDMTGSEPGGLPEPTADAAPVGP